MEFSLDERKRIFAHNARGIRKSLCLTQDEFADKLGTSRGNISVYENDKAIPGPDVLIQYLEIGGLSYRQILEERHSTDFFAQRSPSLTHREKVVYRIFIEEINALRRELGRPLTVYKN